MDLHRLLDLQQLFLEHRRWAAGGGMLEGGIRIKRVQGVGMMRDCLTIIVP